MNLTITASAAHLGRLLSAGALALGLTSTALAQSTVFTYQGRVLDNGTNFDGPGQFKFALVTSTNINHQATATANFSGGFVTIYTVTFGGDGYTAVPAVTVSGGGGSGASATAHLTGGVVTSITVNHPGNGNYTSVPTVTVAPPPAGIAYTTYWSNDGTSSAGSEPSAAVGVTVASGLFTVVLGDTTLPNMAAISASLFWQPNLQLRTWFNDGVNGFAVLSPLQSLTPTPYAAFANSASSAASANSVAAANVTGTLGLAQLPGSVVTNGASGLNLSGNLSGFFTGNGAGLTNLLTSAAATPPPGMVLIPAGAFMMGDTLDGGATPISTTVAAFFMDVNLVTWSQWQSVYHWATNHGYGFVHVGAGKAANIIRCRRWTGLTR
jgi:hypothetical protein